MTRTKIIPFQDGERSYYVCMRDYGRRGLEAVVDPEITLRGVTQRVKTGEWKDIAFIDWIHDGQVEDVTDEIMEAVQHLNALEEV